MYSRMSFGWQRILGSNPINGNVKKRNVRMYNSSCIVCFTQELGLVLFLISISELMLS
jgi:hypothetical protein